MRKRRSLNAVYTLACVLAAGCSTATPTPKGLDFSIEPGTAAWQERRTPEFPREPMVAIETGMHTVSVRSIDIDRDEQFLVTGSDDKTIRIWDLQERQLLRTIRVPIAPGAPGKIYAVAISPDGRFVAAGGFTKPAEETRTIYVFDRASGALIKRIGGHASALSLAFGPNGGFLAVALSRGLRVYDTKGFAEMARDEAYGASTYGLSVAANGRLVTTSDDGFIRLYDSRFELVTKIEAPSGRYPFGVAFSPDGREIAVGYHDTTAVDILSGADLTLLLSSDTLDLTNGNLMSVAWSADGERLCAGGRYRDASGAVPLRCWHERGKGVFEDITFGATSTLFDLEPLRAGDFAIGTADPLIAVLDESGTVRWAQRGEIADFRDQTGFRVAENGDVVAFGFEQWGERRARFSVRDGTLEPDSPEDEELRGARTEAPGVDIENWKGSKDPTLNDQPLPLEPHELSRKLDIAPDGDRFVLGTEWALRAFNRDGRQLWRADTGVIVWSVTITGDGKTVIAGLGDGTIRWYDMADGDELLAFFPHADGERWVAWMPEGFFAASEGGEELIGYHLNRGAEELPDFVRLEQMFERYYRPDLLIQRLERNEAPIRVALAEVGNVDALLQASRPPSIELAGREVERIGYSRFVQEVLLGDEGSGIGNVVYRVNGVRIEQVDTRAETHRRGDGRIVRKQPLDLKQGRNEIEARVFTADGKLASTPVLQVVEVDDPRLRPPALYGIVVGIDAYFDSALGLKYAGNDARTFRQTLESLGAPLFTHIDVRLLTDQNATKGAIADAFHDLAGVVGPNDVFVLYLSGHGFAEEGRYHFIPQELRYTNHEAFLAGSLDEEALVGLLAQIKAQKSLVILDTCYAGAAFDAPQQFAMLTRGLGEKTAIDRLMRASGRAFLAASTDRDLALEGYEGHGLYTYALLEGLRGDADLKAGNRDRQVSVTELSEYLDERVPSLSQEVFRRTQVPMRSLFGQSFPVAVVR